MQDLHCTRCGGTLIPDPAAPERCICSYCQKEYTAETADRNTQQMRSLFDETRLETVRNLQRKLYDAVSAEYISREEVLSACDALRTYLPDDFAANFYKLAAGGNVRALNRAIGAIDVTGAIGEADDIGTVVVFLVKSMTADEDYLLALNDLVERAYKKRDLRRFDEYTTLVSERATAVREGVYETSLPRDVFVAYSSKDMPYVMELVEELEEQGFSCFVAARNLRHGVGSVENYDSALKEAMDNCRTLVFVSSLNSRNFQCDALKIELAYVKKQDLDAAPQYRNNYAALPHEYKKPRVEYRIEESGEKRNAADHITNQFFSGYERVYTPAEVADRVGEQIFDAELFVAPVPTPATVPAPAPAPAPVPAPAPEAKPAPAPEAKPTPVPEAKPAPVPEAKPAPVPEAKPAPAPEAKPAPAPEAKPAPAPEAKPAPAPEAKPTPVPEVKSEPQAEVPSAPTYAVGTTFSFGAYTQHTGRGKMPIEWVVLAKEDDRALVLSKLILDCQPFHETKADVTWEMCSLRKWMNDTFLHTAFSAEEQKKLLSVKLHTADHETYGTKGGNDTEDRVFCLSVEEVKRFLTSGESRVTKATAALRYQKKISVLTKGNSVWWLRSAGIYEHCAGEVDSKGEIADNGSQVDMPNRGVRPAMWVNLTALTAPTTVKPVETVETVETETASAALTSKTAVAAEKPKPASKSTSKSTAKASTEPKPVQPGPADPSRLQYTLSKDGKSYSVAKVGIGKGTEFVIPATFKGLPVTAIAPYAFAHQYDKLTSVILPDSIKRIEKEAFRNCTALTQLKLPSGLTDIAAQAFCGCTALRELVIPAATIHMDHQIIEECDSLVSLSVAPNHPTLRVENNCLIEKATGVLVLGCNGSIIPARGITGIGPLAFYGCRKLKSATVPNGVKVIREFTFSRCEELTSVTLPEGLTDIRKEAFFRCAKLETLSVPASTTRIDPSAFDDCASLTSLSVAPGNPVYHSENHCLIETASRTLFRGCKDSQIPTSVTSIGAHAYKGCRDMTAITIPENITSIGDAAFEYCRGLQALTIPASVKRIGVGAVAECRGLTALTIAEGVEAIGEMAFAFSKSLPEVVLPSSVKELGQRAFMHCEGLTSVTLPAGLTALPKGLFWQCKSLARVTIPAGVRTLGDTVFSGCNMTDMVIPDGVTGLPENSFAFCERLASVTIPGTVTSIGKDAFEFCEKLKKINFGGTLAAWEAITKDPRWDYETPLYTVYCTDGAIKKPRANAKATPKPVASTSGTEAPKPSAPASSPAAKPAPKPETTPKDAVKDTAKSAVKGAVEKAVKEAVKDTAKSAVKGAVEKAVKEAAKEAPKESESSLTPSEGLKFTRSTGQQGYTVSKGTCKARDVVIPATYEGLPVFKIEKEAFQNDQTLRSIVIPEGVTAIGDRAFYGCSSLWRLSIPASVKDLAHSALGNCFKLTSLLVAPENTVYYSANSCIIHKKNKALIKGCGSSIPEGVTTIEEGAFENSDVKRFIIPASVTKIAPRAFAGHLEALTVDPKNTVYEIKEGCLIEKATSTLVAATRTGTISPDVRHIGAYAFYFSGHRTSIKLPENLETIGQSAFSNSAIESIDIPDSVRLIEANVFSWSPNLTELVLPDGLTSIGSWMLSYCSGLTTVTIPKNVTKIEYGAFQGCRALTTFFYTGTKAQWNAIQKSSGWDVSTGDYKIICTGGLFRTTLRKK